MKCNNCEDTGYDWDTIDACCTECAKGKTEQHKQNKRKLKWHEAEARQLRKKIKNYNMPE